MRLPKIIFRSGPSRIHKLLSQRICFAAMSRTAWMSWPISMRCVLFPVLAIWLLNFYLPPSRFLVWNLDTELGPCMTVHLPMSKTSIHYSKPPITRLGLVSCFILITGWPYSKASIACVPRCSLPFATCLTCQYFRCRQVQLLYHGSSLASMGFFAGLSQCNMRRTERTKLASSAEGEHTIIAQ